MNNDLQPLGNVGVSEQAPVVSVSQPSQSNQQPTSEGRLNQILAMLRGTKPSEQPSSSQPSASQSSVNPSSEFTSPSTSTYQPIETPSPVANATFATPSFSSPSPAETTAPSLAAASFVNESLSTAVSDSPMTTEASAAATNATNSFGSVTQSPVENSPTATTTVDTQGSAPVVSEPIVSAVDMSTVTQAGDASQAPSEQVSVSPSTASAMEPNLNALSGTDSDAQNQPNMRGSLEPSIAKPVSEAPSLTPEENRIAGEVLGMLINPDNQAVLAKLAEQLSS